MYLTFCDLALLGLAWTTVCSNIRRVTLGICCLSGYKPSNSSLSLRGKETAMAGNRTRVNCLEGSYAYHYTTIACEKEEIPLHTQQFIQEFSNGRGRGKKGGGGGGMGKRTGEPHHQNLHLCVLACEIQNLTFFKCQQCMLVEN